MSKPAASATTPRSDKAHAAATSLEPRAQSVPPDWGWNETESARKIGRMLWIAVAIVAVVGVVILVHQTSRSSETTAERRLAAAPEPSAAPKSMKTAEPAPHASAVASVTPIAASAPVPAFSAVAPSAPSPAPAAEPSASASASAGSSAASGAVTVTVEARPPDAVFYRHGKRVSASPMTVELAPGEKKAFELGKPGYGTRKVVVDGTQTKMVVGLRPLPGAN